MTIREMIDEWRRGCSCGGPRSITGATDHPGECIECTEALIDAIGRRLGRPPWWKAWIAARNGARWVAWALNPGRIWFQLRWCRWPRGWKAIQPGDMIRLNGFKSQPDGTYTVNKVIR